MPYFQHVVFSDPQRASSLVKYSPWPGELRGIRNISKSNLVDKYTYATQRLRYFESFRDCRARKAVNSQHNGTLNIQVVTQSHRICIANSSSKTKSKFENNFDCRQRVLVPVNIVESTTKPSTSTLCVPTFLLSNVMSLSP
jgi:hypothetical protein